MQLGQLRGMTAHAADRLAAIQAAVQIDPGRRGLAAVPGDNLLTATAGDFVAACEAILAQRHRPFAIVTGFFIPSAEPPAFETDGPLGAAFLARAMRHLGLVADVIAEEPVLRAVRTVLPPQTLHDPLDIALERSGPTADGTCRTMRGRDITHAMQAINRRFTAQPPLVAIGDGGNEVGMGKIPHATIAANIPGGAAVHCCIPCEHLVVAGVSNWGGYALAAGLLLLAEVAPPPGLFDAEAERAILEGMVAAGPLVDGVSGQFRATVDGLSWADYVKPLNQIAAIVLAP